LVPFLGSVAWSGWGIRNVTVEFSVCGFCRCLSGRDWQYRRLTRLLPSTSATTATSTTAVPTTVTIAARCRLRILRGISTVLFGFNWVGFGLSFVFGSWV